MSLEQLRQDFPMLQQRLNNKPIVYFDNACVSLRPQVVIDAITQYYQEYSACGGRSMHKLGKRVTQECAVARQIIANFIHAQKPEEVIFTRNTTEGINLVARSLNLTAGDVVLTSDKEHNSNLVPWQVLAKQKNIAHKIIPSNPDNTFNLETYQNVLNTHKGKVKLVAIGYTSNLDGVTFPIKDIVKLAHQAGAKVLVDAAQAMLHHRIDVQNLDVDFLAFSGHKMLGPSGMGILYGKYDLLEQLEPFLVGGDTVEYTTYTEHKFLSAPKKFEAGLQDYAGMIGLGTAAKYLESLNYAEINQQEFTINKYITEQISQLPKLHIIGPVEPAQRGSIVSFYVDGVDSHKIALMLDESANIMVRSGQHCVHSWFNAHNIHSSVRVSFSFYNTLAEAELFATQLKKILMVL
ncbi:MAG: aminotransferase class V-fold PLP-dependent enzyme [Patescibacteria group bacterium]